MVHGFSRNIAAEFTTEGVEDPQRKALCDNFYLFLQARALVGLVTHETHAHISRLPK